MKTNDEIQTMINDMRVQLEETSVTVNHTKGPVQDAVRVVLPMMKDLLDLNQELLEMVVANHSTMQSQTDPRLYSGQ